MDDHRRALFEVFRQIGIINQLSGTMLQRRLPDGLHLSHFGLLSNLVNMGDGKTPAALSSAFQVPKGTMAHTLAVLEKRGLIEQRPNPGDGRSKHVFLTEAGRAAFFAAIESMATPLSRLPELVDVEEVVGLLPALNALRAVLDENRDL